MATERTAAQVLSAGPRKSFTGFVSKDSYREYCRDLYVALKRELIQDGQSPALERLLCEMKDLFTRGDIKQISATKYAPYLSVWYTYLDLVKHDAQSVEQYLYGPFIGKNDWRWAHLEGDRLLPVRVSAYMGYTESLIRTAKDAYRNRQPKQAPVQVTVHPAPSGNHEDEFPSQEDASRFGRQPEETSPPPDSPEAARILAEARKKDEEAAKKLREAEQLLERVRSEAKRSDSLREQFASLLKENDQAEDLVKSARAAADKMLADAREECASIRKSAEDYYEKSVDNAWQQAGKIQQTAEEQARQSAGALIKRYLRAGIADNTPPETVFLSDRSEQVSLSKEAAIAGAYQIERDLREQLDSFKHEMQVQLNDWRRNLYGQEYAPLAEYYQTLYRQLGGGSKNVQAIVSQISRLESMEAPTPEDRDLILRLQKLQKELTSLVEQLGKVMSGLGLEIVLPRPGDPFDRELHIDEEAESGSDFTDGEIETARYPAVCGRDASGNRMPLRLAAVTLKKKTIDEGEDQ